jgi:DNA-binding NtrC family response regulator
MGQILIVDDQECVRRLLRAELTLAGYHVAGVDGAETAREYLSSSRPELVVLDLYLDGPEGFALLDDIKAHYPDVPVIVLTAYDGFRDDPRLCKADGYFMKSFDFEGLKQAIAKILERKTDRKQKVGKLSPLTSLAGS